MFTKKRKPRVNPQPKKNKIIQIEINQRQTMLFKNFLEI